MAMDITRHAARVSLAAELPYHWDKGFRYKCSMVFSLNECQLLSGTQCTAAQWSRPARAIGRKVEQQHKKKKMTKEK
jgi:hypothetical protein